MKALAVGAFLAAMLAGNVCDAAPAAHRCAADAALQARKLLAFYIRPEDGDAAPQFDIDESARKINSIKALRGPAKYDVLELWGRVIKARYRMRFIYADVGGQCVLMGEEILEDSIL